MNNPFANFVGSIPENYDKGLGPFLFEPYALDIVNRIDGKNIRDVLEIACGTGRVTRHLRKAIPADARLVATDLNPDMLVIAKSKHGDENIEWQTADAQELPFAEESFDLVVCQYGYMFVPDKPRAIAEAYRVLRKGGVFLFNTWDKLENNGPPAMANKVVTGYFEADPPMFYQVPFSMHDPKELETLATNAGFKDVKVEFVKKEGRSESALQAAKGFVHGNPVYNEIMKKDPALVDIVTSHVAKELSKKFGDSPMVATLQAFVCTCRK